MLANRSISRSTEVRARGSAAGARTRRAQVRRLQPINRAEKTALGGDKLARSPVTPRPLSRGIANVKANQASGRKTPRMRAPAPRIEEDQLSGKSPAMPAT